MSEPDSTSISDLMARDPLSLTKSDRSKIIEYYRNNRTNFIQGIKTPKAAKAVKTKADVPNLDLDLGDL